MKGFNIAEEGHIVLAQPPIDIDTGGGATCVQFSMENYEHASIIIAQGVNDAVPGTITISECTDSTGAGATDIGFSYYAETTADGDTMGARTTVANTGVALSANDNTFYCIELDASELSDGYPYVQVNWSNPGGSTLGTVVVVLSGARFQPGATAIV